MRQAIVSNTIMLVALLLAGPVAWVLMRGLDDAQGGHGTSLVLSSSPVMGVARGLGVVLISAAVGVISARMVSLQWAMWNSGVVLAWAASGLGSMTQIVQARGEATGVLPMLAAEAALLAVMVVPLAMVIEKIASGTAQMGTRSEDEDDEPLGKRRALLAGAVVVAGAGVAVIAGLAMISNHVGQGVFAVIIGCMAGGVGASILRPAALHRAGGQKAIDGIGWPIVAGAMLAGVGSLLAMHVMGPRAGRLTEAVLGVTLWGGGRITPMAWAAGALMGAPLGLWLASGLVHRVETKAEART
jgi:hypothetical protein